MRKIPILRDYQIEAVKASGEMITSHRAGSGIVVLPTGSGKSLVGAQAMLNAFERHGKRPLLLTHKKELLVQDEAAIKSLNPFVNTGVYCAGLDRKEPNADIVLASIASVYRDPGVLGKVDVILIDECFPGWTRVDGMEIKDIRPGDYVTSFNHGSMELEKKKVLATSVKIRNEMRLLWLNNGDIIACTPNHPIWAGESYEKASSITAGMHVMQKTNTRPNSKPGESISPIGKGLLLKILREDYGEQADINKKKEKQSDEKPGDKVESIRDIKKNRTQTKGSGRQWKRDDKGRVVIDKETWGHMEMELRSKNRDSEREGISNILQDRYSEPTSNDRRGSRRGVSLHIGEKSAGPKEGSDFNKVRVDCCATIKLDSETENRVYNLHVDGNENYFANNVLAHNCHLIPKKANTMYGKVLRDHYNSVPRVGLSATPFRLDSGLLTDGKDALFDEVLIQITARELVDAGWLSPLVGIGADKGLINTEGVHKRAGEFVTSELEQAVENEKLVQEAASEIIRISDDRLAHLMFCVSVDHANMVADEMNSRGWDTRSVWGDMHKGDQAAAIDALKAGEIRALTSVGVLTTGIDIPRIDCIDVMRPSMSRSLHIQMLGRGMRLFDGKDSCQVNDFSGNCMRHGDIDDLGIDDFVDLKQERVDSERKKRARDAQTDREARSLGHNAFAANIDPMSGGGLNELYVFGVSYAVRESRRDYTRKDLIVTYKTSEGEVRKWLCVEHKKAKHFADRWFALRGIAKKDVPYSAHKARELAQGLEVPISISTAVNAKGFQDILVEHFEDTGGNGDESFD